ncbi:23S rRNA (adenine(2503)-C(2))-methyltransferase RlmN [uncultured Sneathia sp.]|uniref:23S rRNA (adenine(2503)-C(2))-methyltransferase RlmN n=1 Tax=uncultured Sneathia sp. TaxID=278067 RepID=UPI00259B8FF8|nr:23S rRNA (adenine(2503)-C(2))-methyltransferase RlmN [uncultured Sneathia sp.]
MEKVDILSLDVKDLQDILKEHEINGFVARQIYDFLHNKLEFNFDNFNNIKKETRSLLKDLFYIPELKKVTSLISKDKQSEKYLFSLNDKLLLESVLLTHDNRKTLCVSSQIGCPLRCDFCATGTMKFEKNLTASEIIMQFYLIQKDLKKKNQKISNIVYMGMGEPFLNYDNVIKSVNILNNPNGQNVSKRNFTISTSGLINEIKKLADDEKQVHLAISLHSAIQSVRDKLMPINKRYSLEKLSESLKYYQDKTNNRITFEYILIDDLNMDKDAVSALTKFIKQFNAHVNLIPYNKVFGKPYITPSKTRQHAFYNALKNNKINVTLRDTKGQDIAAACGQLKIKKEKEQDGKNN